MSEVLFFENQDNGGYKFKTKLDLLSVKNTA